MNARRLVNRLLDDPQRVDGLGESLDEPAPEHYLGKLPPTFKPGEVIQKINAECAYCMDSQSDKQAFMAWIKKNENLFPDVARALQVIQRNDSWCTDDLTDMTAFFEALGFRFTDNDCPYCEGTGVELEGGPDEDVKICLWCGGSGKMVSKCECDEVNRHNDTVCAWCAARGRKRFNDPPV